MPIDSITESLVQAKEPGAIASPWPIRGAQFKWGSLLIGLLIAVVYYRVLGKLVLDWYQIPDFSHGFLVPIFAGYLVWANRKSLLETRLAPSWSGIAVIALGLVVLLLGVDRKSTRL